MSWCGADLESTNDSAIIGHVPSLAWPGLATIVTSERSVRSKVVRLIEERTPREAAPPLAEGGRSPHRIVV